MTELVKSVDETLDIMQAKMLEMEQVSCPLTHIFTKGLYTRQIFMPADSLIISKIHKTQHIYNVSLGVVNVFNKIDDFAFTIQAPYIGITKPGTRRLLYVVSDCIWTTSHPLPYITGEENGWSDRDKEALIERIEADIIETRDIYKSLEV